MAGAENAGMVMGIQNDRLKSEPQFVKQKLARKGRKTAIYQSQILSKSLYITM